MFAQATLRCSLITNRLARGGGTADKGTSLGFAVGRGHPLFALTPSPSPTLWERGVGARGSAPCSAFPLSRLAGEGDKGGEGNTARLPVHACAGKNSPCCRDSVPSRCTLVRGGTAWRASPITTCPQTRQAGRCVAFAGRSHRAGDCAAVGRFAGGGTQATGAHPCTPAPATGEIGAKFPANHPLRVLKFGCGDYLTVRR
jgi:hypothetical protein